MIKSTSYFIGLAVSLSLFSCSNNPSEQKLLPFSEIVNMDTVWINSNISGAMEKKVMMGSKIESKYMSNPNWVDELKPFTEANFNIPKNRDNYTITTANGKLSNLREISYVAKSKDLPTQWAVYRFEGTKCTGISLSVHKKSKGYDFQENLTFLPQEGYSIDNAQNLQYIESESFFLSGKFVNKPQSWRMFFEIGEVFIPVNFKLSQKNEDLFLSFTQGAETIEVKASLTDSGYFADIPVFQSYLHFTLVDDELKGNWHNLDKGDDYIIPFTANPLSPEQFFQADPTTKYPDFNENWEVYFGEGADRSAAIGIFDRYGNDLIGTFATETGDYRFLQGKVVGDSFSLSTFDGSHLFLFTGKITGDQITNGKFYSGNHYQTSWTGQRNNDFKLADPESMTQIDSNQKFDFSFPDLEGNMVSLSDEKYKDKVVVVQILGSWCPNCMDETRYFVELHEKLNGEDIEFVGLAFERHEDFELASKSLKKAISDLNVPYPLLIAGTPRKSHDALPMIEKIKSYPTSIFLNKKGEVVKIHTGFYGPSTGELYTEYQKETESFIHELLKN